MEVPLGNGTLAIFFSAAAADARAPLVPLVEGGPNREDRGVAARMRGVAERGCRGSGRFAVARVGGAIELAGRSPSGVEGLRDEGLEPAWLENNGPRAWQLACGRGVDGTHLVQAPTGGHERAAVAMHLRTLTRSRLCTVDADGEAIENDPMAQSPNPIGTPRIRQDSKLSRHCPSLTLLTLL